MWIDSFQVAFKKIHTTVTMNVYMVYLPRTRGGKQIHYWKAFEVSHMTCKCDDAKSSASDCPVMWCSSARTLSASRSRQRRRKWVHAYMFMHPSFYQVGLVPGKRLGHSQIWQPKVSSSLSTMPFAGIWASGFGWRGDTRQGRAHALLPDDGSKTVGYGFKVFPLFMQMFLEISIVLLFCFWLQPFLVCRHVCRFFVPKGVQSFSSYVTYSWIKICDPARYRQIPARTFSFRACAHCWDIQGLCACAAQWCSTQAKTLQKASREKNSNILFTPSTLQSHRRRMIKAQN